MKKLISALLSMALIFGLIPFGALGASAAPEPNNRQIEFVGGESDVTYHDIKDIKISKTIAPVLDAGGKAIENYFDITLQLSSPPHELTHAGDIVLVMDVSATMNEDHNGVVAGNTGFSGTPRIDDAKAAALQFVNKMAAHQGSHRIGIVTFATHATNVTNGLLPDNDSKLKDLLGTGTGSIQAQPDSEETKKFTNIEGGLLLAKNMLKGSVADYKYIILLTDGFPTTYAQSSSSTDTSSIDGYVPRMDKRSSLDNATLGYDKTADAYNVRNEVNWADLYSKMKGTSGQDGFFYNTNTYTVDTTTISPTTCLYGVDYSDRGAQKAQAMADAITQDNETTNDKNAINIFTIGLDIGSLSIQNFIEKHKNNPFTTVDVQKTINNETDYTIYSKGGSGNARYSKWLEYISGGPIFRGELGASLTRYWDASSSDSLNAAYDSIISVLETVQRQHFREGTITDPMGENVEFLGFHQYKNNNLVFDGYCDNLNGVFKNYNDGGENEATFDNSNNTITWDPVDHGWKATGEYAQKSDGSGGFVNDTSRPIYAMELKYRVRLTNEAAGFDSKADDDPNETTATINKINTNGTTQFRFRDWNNQWHDPSPFLIPQVEGYLGEFSFVKTDNVSTTNVLEGAEFTLKHNDDCAVCKAAKDVCNTPNYEVNITDISATSDNSGKVEFNNIPSGHEYTMTEKTAPAGYQLVNDKWKVVVSYNDTKVYAFDKIANAYSTTPLDLSNYSIANEPLADIEVPLDIQKLIDGDTTLTNLGNRTFEFALLDNAGNPIKNTAGEKVTVVTDKTTGKAVLKLKYGYDGAISDDRIATEAIGDLNVAANNQKVYTYKIKEIRPADPDNYEEIIYDTAEKTVTVTIGFNTEKTAYTADVVYSGDFDSNAEDLTVNNRNRKPVTVPLSIVKTLDDNEPGTAFDGAFQFVIEKDRVGGERIETISSDADGKVAFTTLSFNKSGPYTYYISELVPDEKISHDTTVYELIVNVAKPGETDAAYKATTKITKINGSDKVVIVPEAATGTTDFEYLDKLKFENKTRLPVTVPLNILKTFDGKAPGSKEFDFILVNLDNPAEIYTAVNDADGKVVFPGFETRQFNASGTYRYQLYEATLLNEKQTNEQWVYAPENYFVTVNVTAPVGEPSFVADVEIKLEGYAEPFTKYVVTADYDTAKNPVQSVDYILGNGDVKFENGTRGSAEVVLRAKKKLNYRRPAKDEVFKFVLVETTGGINKVIDNAENKGYDVKFDKLTFNKSGTYTYTISESKGHIEGMKYDNDKYYVTVVVTADVNSRDDFKADVSIKLNDKEVQPSDVIFSNHYYRLIPNTGDISTFGMFAAIAAVSALVAAAIIIKKRRSNQ